MKKELPYQLVATLASHGSPFPLMPKNRRPAVQRIIENFERCCEEDPFYEHWSQTGLTINVLMTYLVTRNEAFYVKCVPSSGWFLSRARNGSA